MARVMLVAAAMTTCLSCATHHQAPQRPALEPTRYTFPLGMSGNTLICVESLPMGYEPCVTLTRLRHLARDTEAN